MDGGGRWRLRLQGDHLGLDRARTEEGDRRRCGGCQRRRPATHKGETDGPGGEAGRVSSPGQQNDSAAAEGGGAKGRGSHGIGGGLGVRVGLWGRRGLQAQGHGPGCNAGDIL